MQGMSHENLSLDQLRHFGLSHSEIFGLRLKEQKKKEEIKMKVPNLLAEIPIILHPKSRGKSKTNPFLSL